MDVLLAWLFGRAERRRVGIISIPADERLRAPESRIDRGAGFNLAMTAVLLWALVVQVLPLPLLFMIGAAVALVVNFPALPAQRERLAAHAPAILAVASLIFAASVFTGILNEGGMAKAMADAIVRVVPDWLGPHLAVVTALISIPVTWMVSNDVFYYGMLPVLAEAAAHYGITSSEMARASLIGQPVHMLSPLVASTYLLVGMLGVDYGGNQRFTFKWSAITCRRSGRTRHGHRAVRPVASFRWGAARTGLDALGDEGTQRRSSCRAILRLSWLSCCWRLRPPADGCAIRSLAADR
jgi:CitMHS family citrate-Mg2+:H+ or citrate-Ca2+:H+ symporter